MIQFLRNMKKNKVVQHFIFIEDDNGSLRVQLKFFSTKAKTDTEKEIERKFHLKSLTKNNLTLNLQAKMYIFIQENKA